MQAIKTGLLSYGMSGKLFHSPFLETNPGFSFHAVWERSKNLAQQKHPSVKTYRTLEDLLRDEDAELVIVNTPNTTHYAYAKQALEAGKHVVVEKPFVVSVKEGKELIALAKAKGKVLSVYQNRRYDSDFRTVKKILSEGWLGNLVEAEFHFDRYNPNLSPKVHKETPGPGTGALYDLGSHIIDQALQLFGFPQALFADIRTVRPASQVDDYFDVLLYYSSLRVRLRCSYFVREPLPGYVLHGSHGSFLKSKTNVQEDALNAGRLPVGEDWGVEPETEWGFLHGEKDGKVVRQRIPSEKGAYNDYFTALYKAIREGAGVPVSAEDGLAVIRVIEAAAESNRQQTVIQF